MNKRAATALRAVALWALADGAPITLDSAFSFFHDADSTTWREGPITNRGDVPLAMLAPNDYPVNCAGQAVPCTGTVDLSMDPHASLCSSVTDGDVVATGKLKFPPYCLTQVIAGNVIISGNEHIVAMTGFGNLVSIDGKLVLENNKRLVSVRGLDALETIAGDFVVRNNGHLVSLTELDNLVVSERLSQQASGAASPTYPVSDDELHLPRRVREQNVWQVRELESTLYREDVLTALVSLHGLGSLRSIGGGFHVVGNPELASFTGVDALTNVGSDMLVGFNPKLASFQGASELLSIGGGLRIVGNMGLLSLDGATKLADIGQELFLARNSELVEVGNLAALVNIGGNLTLWRNEKLQTFSSGLPGLGLVAVGGSVIVEDNSELANMQGLGQLEAIGQALYVVRNPKLSSLAGGLTSLSQVGGDMFVQGRLTSYEGLDSLSSVGGSLVIHALPLLASLRGLGSLERVDGNLTIQANPQLVSISDLSSLSAVGDRIEIYNNPVLSETLGFLDGLQTVGSYVKVDMLNGTIDCPRGSGVAAGDTPLIFDTTASVPPVLTSATNFGNWCTFNCRHPYVVTRDVEKLRMWQCRDQDFWSASWGPSCRLP